jgi:hypothetical protein
MLAITKAAGFPKLKYWGVSYGTALGEGLSIALINEVDLNVTQVRPLHPCSLTMLSALSLTVTST